MDDDRDIGATRQRPADPALPALPHRCGRCGAANPADATFCAACHALLAAYDAPAGAQPLAGELSPDGRASPRDALVVDVAADAPPSDEPAAVADVANDPDASIPLGREAAIGDEPTIADPATDDDRTSSWLDPPRLDDEFAHPVALGPERDAPPAYEPEIAPTRLTDEPPVAVLAPADRLPATPTSRSEIGHEAAWPVLAERRERAHFVPAAGPRKSGRLARASPAALLLVSGILALGACGLIVAAELADSVGAVGIAGLALGAMALYVLAVGLVQAVLRR